MNLLLASLPNYWKRAFQAMFALTAAICIYKLFNLNYGYWIALSAVITIRATIGASIKRARERLFGTILGVLVAVALINLFPNSNVLLYIAIPLLVFLSVYFFNRSYYYCIFFITILLILLIAHNSHSPWHFAFARILDTFIGLAIGLTASYVFWPNASQDELKQNLQGTLKLFQEYFNLITAAYLNPNSTDITIQKTKIETILVDSLNSFKDAAYEPGIVKVATEATYAFIISINTIYNILTGMNLAIKQTLLKDLSAQDAEKIQNFIQQVNLGFAQIQATLAANSQMIFDFDSFRTDVALVNEQQLKKILQEKEQNCLGLLLFVYELKKLAIELKYMQQSAQQIIINS